MSDVFKGPNHIGVFDCETNGKPRDYKAPMSHLDNWPRVIQLAWKVYDLKKNVLTWGNYLIKPDGWIIPSEETHGKDAEFWITHGFTMEKSMADGVPIREALLHFAGDIQSVEWLFAHNLAFDYNVVGAEMIRAVISSERKPQRICTMERTVDLCKIRFPFQRDTRPWMPHKYKWPKLEELHQYLFGKSFAKAHSADGDVDALADCVFELIERKHIELLTQDDAAKI